MNSRGVDELARSCCRVTLIALILELNMLLALAGAALALVRSRAVRGRKAFATLALGGALWCAGELLVERDLIDSWAGVRLATLGIAIVGPFWLAVAFRMGGLAIARRVPWLPIALATPGLLLFGLLFFEPWSALVLRGPHQPGPLWWGYSLYTYGLILAGSAIHVATAVRDPVAMRRGHRVFVGLAALFPLAVHVVYAWGDMPWPYDPTPLAFMPVGLGLAAAIFPGGLLDMRPILQQELVDHLPLGVVLADRSGAVIDLNPCAETVLGMSRAEALGRSLDAIVAEAPKRYRVEITAVQRLARKVGTLAFLHPPPARD